MDTVKKTPKHLSRPLSEKAGKGEKLQKVLAHLGLGSRRQIERWIEEGRLSIDGQLARLGDRVCSGQAVNLDEIGRAHV